MNWSHFMRDLIYGGSALGAGVAFGLGIIQLIQGRKNHHIRNLYAGVFDLGIAGVVFLVLYTIVIPSQQLPIQWTTVLYFICLLMVCLGGLGLIHDVVQGNDQNGRTL